MMIAWRRSALALVATAALASGAAAQDILPDLRPRQPADQGVRPPADQGVRQPADQGVDFRSLPDADDQSLPELVPQEQDTDPEQTEALPALPDAPASEELVEPETGAPPEPELAEPEIVEPPVPDVAPATRAAPEVVRPVTPQIAAPSAPQAPVPDASTSPATPAIPDVDPGKLPDGDKTADQPVKVEVNPLRLGVVPSGQAAATIAALQPLRDSLAAKLGRPVEILPIVTYSALIDAQTLQRIDGGLFTASAYAAAEAMCHCLEPLATPAAEDGSAAYQALIVVRPESGITAAAGLQGKVVATAGPGSVGGRRMQLAGLMAEGLDVKTLFGTVRTMPSAIDAVRLVLQGEADAAFAWGPVGQGAGDAGQGTLAQLAATGELGPSALNVIWRSPAIEHGPFAVAKTLPEDTKAVIRDVLVGLAAAAPDVYDTLSPIYGGGFVAVEPSAYKGVALLAEQNIDAALPPATAELAAPRIQPQAAQAQPPR